MQISSNPAQRHFFLLAELANRWERSVSELLASALSGHLIVLITHFKSAEETVVPVMRETDPDDAAHTEFVFPDWGALLKPEDLAEIAQYGKASVSFGHRYDETGRFLSCRYDPPRTISVTDLVVPADFVNEIEDEKVDPMLIGEGEKETLLKTVAVLALAMVGDTKAYFHGAKPNSSAIAKQVIVRLNNCPQEFKSQICLEGLSEQNLRKKISAGLKLLAGEK